MKYEGIVFDLDYTLYDEHLYFFAVFEKFCDAFHCHVQLPTMKELFFLLRGKSDDVFRDILVQCGFTNNVSEVREKIFQIYTSIHTHLPLYADAISLIEMMKGKKLRLSILTNGVIVVQENKIKCLSIGHYFDTICFARTWGKEFEKPHMRSFERVSDIMKIVPDRLLFVGDNPNIDFQGAKTICGHTVRLRRGIYKEVPPNQFIDYEINSLEEIEAILVCTKK